MHSSAKRLKTLSTKPKRVEIEWIDSASLDGWHEAQSALDQLGTDEQMTCFTCGFLIEETETAYTMASHYTLDPRTGLLCLLGSPLCIPKVAVVVVRELRR